MLLFLYNLMISHCILATVEVVKNKNIAGEPSLEGSLNY